MHPSGNNVKWILFTNYTVIRMPVHATVAEVGVAKLNWALPTSSVFQNGSSCYPVLEKCSVKFIEGVILLKGLYILSLGKMAMYRYCLSVSGPEV